MHDLDSGYLLKDESIDEESSITEEQAFDRAVNQSSKTTRVFNFLSYAVFPIGFASTVPFLQLSFDAARGIPGLGYVLSGATFLSSGAGASWVLKKLLNQMEFSFNELKGECTIKESVKIIAANTLGILSSAIPSYIVYVYNSTKWLVFIAFPTSYAFSTFGYYSLLSNNIPVVNDLRLKLKLFNKNSLLIADTKHSLIAQLEGQVIPNLLNGTVNTQNLLDIPKNRPDLILNELYRSNLIHFRALKRSNKVENFRLSVMLISCAIPICMAYVNSILSEQEATSLVNSKLFSIPFVILTVSPGLVIDLFIVPQVISDISLYLYKKILATKSSNYLDYKYPFGNKILNVSYFLMACLSTSGKYFVAFNASHSHLISFIATFSATLFEYFALRDLSQSTIQFVISKINPYENRIIAAYQKLQLCINSIAKLKDNEVLQLRSDLNYPQVSSPLIEKSDEDEVRVRKSEQFSFKNYLPQTFWFRSSRRDFEAVDNQTQSYSCAIV